MKKLLVATDFSELARQAYLAAASLAKAYDAEICLVHQAEPLPSLYTVGSNVSVQLDEYYDRLHAELERETEQPALKNLRVSTHLLCTSQPSATLVDFAHSEQCDLIVMSTHGRSGLTRSLLGSFTEEVARHSAVPVLTYRKREVDAETFEPRSVLVPFDLSENSKAVFPLVRLLGERYDGEVKILHVFPEVSVRGDWGNVQERLRVAEETASTIEKELRTLCEQELPQLKTTVESRFGDAYREIIKESRMMSPDLIVMATHGWTGLKHLYFGSVAEKVLRTSSCSVLTVRPKSIQEEPPS